MALKYYLKGFDHQHELSQFSRVLGILKDYYSQKSEIAYLIGGPRNNGCDLDALLLTSKFVVGIEFKNYGNDGYSVDVTENAWFLCDAGGRAVLDEENNPVEIKGGSQKNPVDQAGINRRGLRDSLMNFLYRNRLTGDERRRKENEVISHVPWFVVFNKELTIQNRMGDNTKKWLKVVTNSSLTDTLELKSREYRGVFMSDTDIRKYLEELGFRDLKDAETYREPVMGGARSTRPQSNQGSTSTGGSSSSSRWGTNPMGGGWESFPGLSKYYYKLAERGELVFLALMSCIMAYMMMQRWWWGSQSMAMNIGGMIVVAFVVWLMCVPVYTQHTRKVPKNGEMIDGIPRIKGLNKFSFSSVFFCHVCWVLFAGVVYYFLPLFLNRIINDQYAFYGLLRIMCSLLQQCVRVIGIWAGVSFLYRLYEMCANTLDENSLFSRYCLIMMPFTRSDITKRTLPDYRKDFVKWIKALLNMSSLIPVIWVALTYFTDNNQFMDRFHYWPFKTVQVEQTSTDSLSDDNVGNTDGQTQKNSSATKNGKTTSTLSETLPPPPVVNPINVDRMYFEEGKGGFIKLGQTLQLHLKVEPADCDEEFTFEYAKDANQNEIIRVDNNLLVTPIREGQSLIVVTSSRTKTEAQYLVHVEP